MCLCAITLGSCTRSPTLSSVDFPGTYIITYSHGVESLRLSNDGHYQQSYTATATSKPQTNSGTWRFFKEPDPYVHLDDALLFDTRRNEPQLPPQRTGLGLKVRVRYGGQIELVLSEDEHLGYRKRKTVK